MEFFSTAKELLLNRSEKDDDDKKIRLKDWDEEERKWVCSHSRIWKIEKRERVK
jgi:hypothetical protein